MFIPAVTLETSVTLTGRLLDLLHECLMDIVFGCFSKVALFQKNFCILFFYL